TMKQTFKPLPNVPDHPALERELLERWEQERTFERLREQNRGKHRWSFMDGPITANNPMGVHHAWGRALKDVFQRYKALRGFDERYQNGFDCQGLWVEVEVEKELGLNSKREIEDYGIAEFAERCKARVAKYVGVMTEQSKRLGQWMDWGNDYLTFSDTSIEYIWRFLAETHRRGRLYKGHRSTQWCPRCGTSLSQHEQAGEENYRELEHPSLYVRFPLKGRAGEALVVWTTTPWTLPANVAAAVKPDADYVLRDGGWRLAGEDNERTVKGEELVGLEYEGPFDDLPAQEGIVHRVIPWDEVALDEGTGIVHIAPGAGSEDFELSRVHGLPVPFYPCSCGHLNVIGSLAELKERATGGLDQLQELHRPWIDEVPIRCERCSKEVRRIPEVGDAWLDAGIVPLSTLGWQNPEWVEHGYATGAAEGLSGADLPDHAYWEQWFPADWVSESREQIRLWFYSISFMAMTLVGRLPYRAVLAYERVRDEHGREMHKSTGNAIEANEAFERMGADIARWLYFAQPPSQ